MKIIKQNQVHVVAVITRETLARVTSDMLAETLRLNPGGRMGIRAGGVIVALAWYEHVKGKGRYVVEGREHVIRTLFA